MLLASLTLGVSGCVGDADPGPGSTTSASSVTSGDPTAAVGATTGAPGAPGGGRTSAAGIGTGEADDPGGHAAEVKLGAPCSYVPVDEVNRIFGDTFTAAPGSNSDDMCELTGRPGHTVEVTVAAGAAGQRLYQEWVTDYTLTPITGVGIAAADNRTSGIADGSEIAASDGASVVRVEGDGFAELDSTTLAAGLREIATLILRRLP